MTTVALPFTITFVSLTRVVGEGGGGLRTTEKGSDVFILITTINSTQHCWSRMDRGEGQASQL